MPRQRATCSRRRLTVVREGSSLRQLQVEFLGDQRDGRQRRSELVGRRRRQAVELGEVLLAGEHQFGRGQRLGELACLLGDAPSVDACERDAEQDGGPDAAHVEERQLRVRPASSPGQRTVRQHEQGRAADREEAQAQRPLRRERGGRDQNRRQEQDRKGILETPGQVKKRCQLQDVEGEQQGRRIVAQAVARGIVDAQRQIEPRPQRR